MEIFKKKKTENESDSLLRDLSLSDHATFPLTFQSQQGPVWMKSVSVKAFMSWSNIAPQKAIVQTLTLIYSVLAFCLLILWVFTVHELEEATISECTVSPDMLCLCKVLFL